MLSRLVQLLCNALAGIKKQMTTKNDDFNLTEQIFREIRILYQKLFKHIVTSNATDVSQIVLN